MTDTGSQKPAEIKAFAVKSARAVYQPANGRINPTHFQGFTSWHNSANLSGVHRYARIKPCNVRHGFFCVGRNKAQQVVT